jgi:hypothetical protein
VVHDDGEVLVAALVADLVDPDAAKTVEGVVGDPGVVDHPGDDRPHRPPRHPQQLAHRRLRGVGHQPGNLVVEVPRVAGTMAGPGHLGHGRAVLSTVHPGSISLEVTEEDADVEGPPVPSPHTLVVAGGTTPAEPASAFRRTPRPNVDHHGSCLFVEVDSLDHRRPVDTEQFAPYVGTEHAILLASFS